jgi:hypothetical protein
MKSGVEIKYRIPLKRGLPVPFEVVVAVGSAGAFTALYQVICKVLEKDKDRELTLEYGKKKIIIKGHSIRKGKEILNNLFPEFIETKSNSKKGK